MKSIHKYLLIFTLLLAVSAQAQKIKNRPNFDRKGIHFGFCIGLFTNDFKINPTKDLLALPGYFGYTTVAHPGYKIGIVTNLRISKHWNFRYIPSFATSQRDIIFDVVDPIKGYRTNVLREIESSFFESPFELKFKSDRIDNYRWYLLGGIKYSYDFASKKKVEDDNIFKIDNSDLAYEFGIGLDFYFEYFKFSPQLKASWGIHNLLIQDGTYLVDGIDGIYSRSILINFTFEG